VNLADIAVVATFAIGAFAIATCSTSCGVQPKTVANVLKPTAEQCVEISQRKNNKELETICATIEDLAPFIPVIFAYQQKRLGLAAGSASASAEAPPPAPPTPAPSASAPVTSASAAVPACSCK
jgi:hypothetical protein